MTEPLEQGLLYFFDQPKIKKEWDKIIGLGERFAYLNSNSSNPYETGCIHRNFGCTKGHAERNDTLMKNSTAKKDPSSPQTNDPSSVFRTICEDQLAQLSQKSSDPLTEEVLRFTLREKYKGMALTMLHELEEALNHFSKHKFVLPQGILNILPCSWEELTEDACYMEKPGLEPAHKSLQLGRWQTSEEGNRLSPTSEYVDCEVAADGIKGQRRRNTEFPAGVTKGAKNPETLLNKLSGNKTVVSEQYASDSPVAISFSLSSKLSEERGSSFQHSDSNCNDREWKGPYIGALERLRLAEIQITQQLSKGSRVDKPVIFRRYTDVGKESFLKDIKGRACKRISSEVLNEKLKLPGIKQPGQALKKLHYELADGSSFIYYPSGHSAVYQSYSNLPDGGMYTNIFDDVPDQVLLGTFTPFGHGSICFPNSNNIAMIYNQEGGMVTNKGGAMLREWKWPGVGKLDTPVIVQVNKCITVKIAGRFAISLVYKWHHESVLLSLSPVRSVVLPQAAKTSRGPEEGPGRIGDFSATSELRKLKRKIKSIMENWLEYYQIAFGLDSPHTLKTFPLQAGRRRKAHPSAVPSDLQRQQRKKGQDNEAPASVDLSRLQSAPARSLRQDVAHASSRAPHLLIRTPKTNQPLVRHINKDKPISRISSKTREKLWHSSSTPCPAALRRAMLGGERKLCSCSNYQIPYVTDLEYNFIINNAVSAPEQIIVICITSLKAADPAADGHLESLYERMNKNRSMPCIQNCLDSFRLLKYDINTADRFTGQCGSLLVKRHNVAPGMFLMYIQGKLLFANYIFNGYSKSAKDLQKQIALTRCDYNRGYYLPTDYRFSSHENSLQSFPEHVKARIPNDVSGCIYATRREACKQLKTPAGAGYRDNTTTSLPTALSNHAGLSSFGRKISKSKAGQKIDCGHLLRNHLVPTEILAKECWTM